VAKRSPYEVLGVDIDASAAIVKAAWRRLARQHHPDLTAGDPRASRAATRQMAEINAAYEELRDPDRRRMAADRERGARARGTGSRSPFNGADGRASGAGAGAPSDGEASGGSSGRPYGPPRPRPGRPVTGRLDTTETFTPRNQTLGGNRRPVYRTTSMPPLRAERAATEPPRASDPTGPLHRRRIRRFRPPASPALTEAQAVEMAFGKFHGHTLGEIAAFEPSYIDWIASTITKDRDLVAAARVIRDDLDARGIPRVRRASRTGPSALP
jgi:curved DNA-binding protein CbpA